MSATMAAEPMSVAETSYGFRKRLRFVANAITAAAVLDVLDVGCGTGTLLTAPLAAMFPSLSFVGTDVDAKSIEYARSRYRDSVPNVDFMSPGELPSGRLFDVIVLSEVLEHVANPSAFLAEHAQRLRPAGKLVITVPNGFGPFEWAARIRSIVARHAHSARVDGDQESADTLADSPHVSFFSWTAIHRLIEDSDLRLVQYQPRTFLCGFGLDRAIRVFGLENWNARIADRLSPRLVSDWMFVVERSAGVRLG